MAKTLLHKSIFVMCIVVLVLSVVSVSALPEAQNARNAAAAVDIHWFASTDAAGEITAMQQVVTAFNDSQTDINLILEVVSAANGQKVLHDRLLKGNPPDIVGPWGLNASSYFYDQWLDLNPLATAASYDLTDYYQRPLNLYKRGADELTGLPLAIYPSFIYYNKSLFNAKSLGYPPHAYGAPYVDAAHGGAWTVDKLAEIAKLLTLDNKGKNSDNATFNPNGIVQFGYHAQWTDLRGEASLFGSGSFIDSNGDAQIPDNWRVAFHWYYSAMWNNRFIPNDPYWNSIFGYGFSGGKIAMVSAQLWFAPLISGVANWDIAALPEYNGTATSSLDMDGFHILQTTPYPAEAFQVLTYLVGDGAEAQLTAKGLGAYPARMSKEAAAVTKLDAQYPNVDWQVMLDSIDKVESISSEGYLPNYAKAVKRINQFQARYRGKGGLNLDAELGYLRGDLQRIFNEKLMFLPFTKR